MLVIAIIYLLGELTNFVSPHLTSALKVLTGTPRLFSHVPNPVTNQPNHRQSDSETFAYPTPCYPRVPSYLLSNQSVLNHPAVLSALSGLESKLTELSSGSRDAFSFALIHASTGKVFSFHNGRTRLNETSKSTQGGRLVDDNSIYRIASVTKAFTVLEALILSRQSHAQDRVPRLTLDTKLKDVLPEFSVPPEFESEAQEITLAMLGSHRAGIGRDIGLLELGNLRDITFPPPKDNSGELSHHYNSEYRTTSSDQRVLNDTFDSSDVEAKDQCKWYPRWSVDKCYRRSQDDVLRLTADTDLIWRVGEMPSCMSISLQC
jgi:hypothetical protein